jgi:hypothetical protein
MDEPVQQDLAIPGEVMVLAPKLLQKDQATSMERANLRKDHGERERCPSGFPQGRGWDPGKLPVVTRTQKRYPGNLHHRAAEATEAGFCQQNSPACPERRRQ